MTRAANIRRLALDIGPWAWALVAFLIFVIIPMDSIWIMRKSTLLPLMPGLFMSPNAAFSVVKMQLWRTLPVSRVDIDRARWWQSVAGPTLLLCVTCAIVALVLAGFGLRYMSWPDIALLALAQSAIGAAMASLKLVVFPWAERRWKGWSLVLLAPWGLAIFGLILLRTSTNDIHAVMLLLAVIGAAAAAALYFQAGHWPMPPTNSLWAAPPKDRASVKPAEPSGLRGWMVLVRVSLPAFAALWAGAIILPLAISFFVSTPEIPIVSWAISFLALPFAVGGLATAMRSLRALPLTSWQLTRRIVLLLLLVQGISLLCVKTALFAGGEEAPLAMFVVMLAYPLLFLPAVMRFGQKVILFGSVSFMIFLIPIQILAPHADYLPWIAPGSLAFMIAGFAWTWWEIARGHRAYRMQPLTPARWRGLADSPGP